MERTRRIGHGPIALSIALMLQPATAARTEGELDAAWLAADREVIAWLVDLVETSGPDRGAAWRSAIEESLGAAAFEETELGFGVLRFRVARPGGYVLAEIEVVEYMGAPVELRAGVTSSAWDEVGTETRRAWVQAGGAPVEPTGQGLLRREIFEDRLSRLHRGMAAVLGPAVDDVPLPDDLRADYDELRSPFARLEVGRTCGYAGTKPHGRALIDRLVDQGRVDLLANILRGYNPEGRVYALLGLRELERRGAVLDTGLSRTMRTVLTSDLPIRFCDGCKVQRIPCADRVGDSSRR